MDLTKSCSNDGIIKRDLFSKTLSLSGSYEFKTHSWYTLSDITHLIPKKKQNTKESCAGKKNGSFDLAEINQEQTS